MLRKWYTLILISVFIFEKIFNIKLKASYVHDGPLRLKTIPLFLEYIHSCINVLDVSWFDVGCMSCGARSPANQYSRANKCGRLYHQNDDK